MDYSSTSYAFGAYRLNVKQRELRRDGVLLGLRPKAFDMLTMLIEQRNRIVSKDELLDQIWPNRYICETTLSACLKELRKVLGDSGSRQSIIKTIPRKGFRFVADLQDIVAGQAPPSTDATAFSTEDQTSAPGCATETPSETNTGLGSSARIEVMPSWSASNERKNISVLRCGLVDADNLAERLEPEALHYLLQDFFGLAQDVIVRFDGQVTQWLGDGFVALFGAPLAYEDHARRALLAAYQLIDRCQDLPQASISVGLSSGEAVINSLPAQPQQCYTAHSHVLHLAETLQTQADPGRVLISLESHRLLRADVRVRALQSCDSGVLVEQIIEARAGVPRRFRRHMAPLIGRTDELNLLQECFCLAEQSQGQVIAIVGPPGIGKSRLLSEFQRGLSSRNVRYLQANCFPHLRGSPYGLLSELLRQYCGIAHDDAASAIEIKLRACLRTAKLAEPATLSLMLKLLDLAYDSAPLDRLSAQAQRDKTAVYLQDLLLSQNQTTVIALEDLQWLDASSQAWLDSFLQCLADRPLLLIATYRPEFSTNWLNLSWASQLSLARLNQEQCQRLLCSLPRSAVLQDQWAELASLSNGNPFFLEELALNAANAGQSIPNTIQGVLAARIDQLEPGDKKLLQVAAIIGQQGPLALLETISGLDSKHVRRALQRLQDAELMFADDVLSEPFFMFKHALVQEVAYGQQISGQRRAVHLRIARTLRKDFPELATRRPEFLAYHYSEAGHHEDAVRAWQRAGRKAYERSAFSEAIDYVNKGLALLERYDNPAARAASELALLRTLAPALVSMQGYGAAGVERTWQRAKQLCEELQDHSALFRVLIGLSHYYLVTGHFARAFEGNRQILRLARQSYNNDLLLRAKAAMGELMLHCGRLHSAKRQLDQCLAIIASDQRPMLSSQVASVTAMGHAAWVYWHLRQESSALDCAERALQGARALQQPFALVIALCLSAELQRFRDDPHKAMELAREGVAIAQKQAFPYWHGSALVTLGWAEARTGDSGRGIATIRQGLSLFRSTGAKIQLSSWLGALADAYQSAGQVAPALSTVNEAISWAEKTGDCYCLSQLLRLQKAIADAKKR